MLAGAEKGCWGGGLGAKEETGDWTVQGLAIAALWAAWLSARLHGSGEKRPGMEGERLVGESHPA